MPLVGIGRNLGNFRETVLLHTYIVASMLCVSAYAVLYNWYFDLIVLFLLFISMGYELDFKLALILLYIYTLYNTILSILYYFHYQRLPTITTTTTAPNYKPNKQYKQPYMLTYTTYIYPQNILENKLSIPKHINRLAYKIINRAKLSMINTK